MLTNGTCTVSGTDEESLALILNAAEKSSPPANSRHPFTQWTASQLRETSLCLIFAILGWNLPKLLFFPTESQILSRTVPFMTLASLGDILLEARYNYEVADPPMVGSWSELPYILYTTIFILYIMYTHSHAVMISSLCATAFGVCLLKMLEFHIPCFLPAVAVRRTIQATGTTCVVCIPSSL